MPLQTGKSKEAFSHNVEVEVAAGKPQKQAAAIAYSKEREAKDAEPEVELEEAIEAGKKEAEHQLKALAGMDVECADAHAQDAADPAQAATSPRLAFDRGGTMRTKDVDGRLHVKDCRISKANICPYLGHEIPDAEKLGLEPDRVYYLYRDAAALAAAAPTAERVPLMMRHVASTAASPQKETIIGCVSNVRWMPPYLVADLTVWDQAGIEAIESERQQELSPGYRYTPVMQSGAIEGERYDGRMAAPIIFNHVAIVDTGRTGPDVMVNDSLAAVAQTDGTVNTEI